jgi:4-aminobutyrate aminotransferase/(S)-3-amino-2-methylpropionate transaminase
MFASGSTWCHELWNLPSSPDVVVFSKKAQIGGFFYKPKYHPEQGYRLFNTWMGDPLKMLALEAIIDTVKEDGLQQRVVDTGKVLKAGLFKLSTAYPNIVSDVRGVGTLLSFTVVGGAKAREDLIGRIRNAGLVLTGCGAHSVRFRPALTFTPEEAEMAIRILGEVCEGASGEENFE